MSVENPGGNPLPPSVAELIRADHEALRSSLGDLATLLSPDPPSGDDFVAWKLEVLGRLRDFQADLLKHFDLEEEISYQGQLVAQAPQYACRITCLEEEHSKIAGDLSHVIATVKRVSGLDTPILIRLDERLQSVLTALHNHEADERELLQDMYYQEFGVAD